MNIKYKLKHRFIHLDVIGCVMLLTLVFVSSFEQVQDLIPFFSCMSGDFMSAFHSLLPSLNPPVSRFTPSLFLVYFRIFETATAPKLMVSEPAQLCCSDATWEPIKGQPYVYYNFTIFTPKILKYFLMRGQTPSLSVDAFPLKRAELVKFALRVQKCCSAVFSDVSLQHSSLLTLLHRNLIVLDANLNFHIKSIQITVTVVAVRLDGEEAAAVNREESFRKEPFKPNLTSLQ